MIKKLYPLLALVAVLVTIIPLATPLLAADFTIPSRWEYDILDPYYPEPPPDTDPNTAVPGWW